MKKRHKYSKEFLEPLVRSSQSFAEIIRKLGLKPGGQQHHIKLLCEEFKIDFSHFPGPGWAKNFTKFTHPSIAKISSTRSLTPDSIFTTKVNYKRASHLLKRALIETGMEYKCAVIECGNGGRWLGQELRLHVDHVDGNPFNNNRENLRFLCPNCHQQTPTWGMKRRSKPKVQRIRKPKRIRRSPNEYQKQRQQQYIKHQEPLIELVLTSNIDFTKFGWVEKVALIIHKKPQKVHKWMKLIMPEFYEGCFKRKRSVRLTEVESARIAPQPSQSCASTNFAITA